MKDEKRGDRACALTYRSNRAIALIGGDMTLFGRFAWGHDPDSKGRIGSPISRPLSSSTFFFLAALCSFSRVFTRCLGRVARHPGGRGLRALVFGRAVSVQRIRTSHPSGSRLGRYFPRGNSAGPWQPGLPQKTFGSLPRPWGWAGPAARPVTCLWLRRTGPTLGWLMAEAHPGRPPSV